MRLMGRRISKLTAAADKDAKALAQELRDMETARPNVRVTFTDRLGTRLLHNTRYELAPGDGSRKREGRVGAGMLAVRDLPDGEHSLSFPGLAAGSKKSRSA